MGELTYSGIQKRASVWTIQTLLAAVLVLATWIYALFIIGVDGDQGDAYRILFVHVPISWSAFLWLIMAGVFGIMALLQPTKSESRDLSSQSCMELGTLYAALSLITGSIWGKPTWGVWWQWEPRLTSTFVMFVVACAYHILRHFTPDAQARTRVSSIIAVISTINVPLVYYSVNIWDRGIHQQQTFTPERKASSPDIGYLLLTCVITATYLGICLYKKRRQAISLQHALSKLREDS